MAAERVTVPDELFEALGLADAWSAWEEQTAELRSLYVGWVTEPRSARERRSRAELTAYYAVHGALDKAVQRPRARDALLSIFGPAVG
jgi:hypothetical protein